MPSWNDNWTRLFLQHHYTWTGQYMSHDSEPRNPYNWAMWLSLPWHPSNHQCSFSFSACPPSAGGTDHHSLRLTRQGAYNRYWIYRIWSSTVLGWGSRCGCCGGFTWRLFHSYQILCFDLFVNFLSFVAHRIRVLEDGLKTEKMSKWLPLLKTDDGPVKEIGSVCCFCVSEDVHPPTPWYVFSIALKVSWPQYIQNGQGFSYNIWALAWRRLFAFFLKRKMILNKEITSTRHGFFLFKPTHPPHPAPMFLADENYRNHVPAMGPRFKAPHTQDRNERINRVSLLLLCTFNKPCFYFNKLELLFAGVGCCHFGNTQTRLFKSKKNLPCNDLNQGLRKYGNLLY